MLDIQLGGFFTQLGFAKFLTLSLADFPLHGFAKFLPSSLEDFPLGRGCKVRHTPFGRTAGQYID